MTFHSLFMGSENTEICIRLTTEFESSRYRSFCLLQVMIVWYFRDYGITKALFSGARNLIQNNYMAEESSYRFKSVRVTTAMYSKEIDMVSVTKI